MAVLVDGDRMQGRPGAENGEASLGRMSPYQPGIGWQLYERNSVTSMLVAADGGDGTTIMK